MREEIKIIQISLHDTVTDSLKVHSGATQCGADCVGGKTRGRDMRQRLLPDWRLDQWMVTVTLTLTHLCNGMCVSLQVGLQAVPENVYHEKYEFYGVQS